MNHDDFTWVLAECADPERPFLIRYIESGKGIDRSTYSNRLNVFWNFRTPTEQGLPSEDDNDETEAFENRLIEAVEAGNHSVLVMVLTGRGQKEYVWQTTDPKLFLKSLTEMPQEEERYPIRIQHYEDKTWDYFDSVLSDVKRRQNKSEEPTPSLPSD